MLRDLQDETGGFLAYIPLAYHPDNNELGEELGRVGTATTGFDDLKNLAVGRLFLDNFRTSRRTGSWSRRSSRRSRSLRRDDLEGTVVREKIYHEAGAHTAEHAVSTLVRLIRGAGKMPVERDSFYQPVRERSTTRRRAIAPARARPCRWCTPHEIGRIPYINCYPVYGAIDRGIVQHAGRARDRVPLGAQRQMAAGALDVSVISAVEYARDAAAYFSCPISRSPATARCAASCCSRSGRSPS